MVSGQHAAGGDVVWDPGRIVTIRSSAAGRSGVRLIMVPFARGLLQQGLGDLGDQGFLGGEMQVEPAVGQAGLLHHGVDADAIHAVLAEQVAGGGRGCVRGFPAFCPPVGGWVDSAMAGCPWVVTVVILVGLTFI